MAERKYNFEQWLANKCGLAHVNIEAMAGDASFRRYFRIHAEGKTFVAMDAPPPQENCQPFVAIAQALKAQGLLAPEIIHADVQQGFLLLTDFGDNTYLNTLDLANADLLYKRALDALSMLQGCQHVADHVVPPFTQDFMWKEWAWHKEWFQEKLLQIPLGKKENKLDQCYALLVESAAAQPQVFMHRDYHSANLMVVGSSVGILDFQDAFRGPVTYDLVSLLRDCYIDWPRELVGSWVRYYYRKLHDFDTVKAIDEQQFIRWFDLMGMQRHLKALLTFARKHVRDNDSKYLQYIPRTLNYLCSVSDVLS